MVNETLEADRAYQKAIAEAKQEAKRQAIESSDCIDRRAVIDIALQYCPDDDGVCSKAGHDPREMLDEIEQLPPAQPEIIRCKDCIHNKEPDFGFCEWANHHVSANSCCADVFHAERRTDG